MRELINILMAGLLFCGGAAAMAASGSTETRTFAAFDRIDVARGIELHVGCGPAAKADLTGEGQQDLSDIVTTVSGHTLKITRTGHSIGRHDGVTIHLTAAQPLVAVSADTGVAAEIEACAVSPEQFDVSASTGVTVDLAGHTAHATLDANTGARIQPLEGQRFDAREAKVSASTGAEIRLCTVEHIDGHASMGSSITAESKDGTVHTAMGASFSVESCR